MALRSDEGYMGGFTSAGELVWAYESVSSVLRSLKLETYR